jgi:hypothetical protein
LREKYQFSTADASYGRGMKEFLTLWSTPIATLGLIAVTVWYAVATHTMARSARESAESAREAAEYASRSAAIAAAGTKVDFAISPTYQLEDRYGREGHFFPGVRIECLGAAVYVHRVRVESVFAPDPALADIEPSLTEVEIYPEDSIPELVGLKDNPILLHRQESVMLDFPDDKWTQSEVATLTVVIDYSFDGRPPMRSRRIEWIGQPGRDFGPYTREDDTDENGSDG